MSTKKHEPGNALKIIVMLFYVVLLIVFAVQTVDLLLFLFPTSDWIMIVLTLVSFDVFAFLWACVLTYYKFWTRRAHTLVKWAWAISFLFSLAASVLYILITRILRLHTMMDELYVDIGYGISIASLVGNILASTFWYMLEHEAASPRRHHYQEDEAGTLPEADVQEFIRLAQTSGYSSRELRAMIVNGKAGPTKQKPGP